MSSAQYSTWNSSPDGVCYSSWTHHASDPESIRDVSSSRSQVQAPTAYVDVSAVCERLEWLPPLVLPLRVMLLLLQCRYRHHVMLQRLLRMGHLAVAVYLLWLPPSVVPVLVRQCMKVVDPVLGPTLVVFERVWRLRWGSSTRGRPNGRDVPGHHPGHLTGEVRLLLEVGSVPPASVLLHSLRRLMRIARRSSPLLILYRWWHSFALWPGCWRPRQRVARSVASWQCWRTMANPLLHTICLSMELWTSWPILTPESHRHHPEFAPTKS